MKFDRNTVIGIVILVALFFGYFYVTNKQNAEFRKQKARDLAVADSIARANRAKDTVTVKYDSLGRADTTSRPSQGGFFQRPGSTTGSTFTVDNSVMRITFSTKGGMVKKVELKQFKGQDSNLVRIAATDYDQIGYLINTGNNQVANTADLVFDKVDSATAADGSRTYTFSLNNGDSAASSSITHKYTVKPSDYMIDMDLGITGADKLLTQGILNLNWQYAAVQQESDISYEKQNTQVGYVKDGSFDYHTIAKRSSKQFEDPVSWVGVRQRFFFTILVAKTGFSSGRIEWTVPPDSAHTVVRSVANMKVQMPAAPVANASFSMYYGPSDYHTLKKYDMKFEKLVNLGQNIYAFVRPLNKFIIMPIWDFLMGLTSNMGLVIALLTIFIRLVTSPLIYKSYLSGAKMKALRPEISKLKDKYGDDRQAMSMEQMKLFREAGVNPLGGCIPALLQIPIFFALFSFFNAEIALRGAEFLWSPDLAAFDDPIKFGFNIPLLGSHLSLFNITAVVTSFLISYYSMSMTPDQSNPVMKYLPYIFPIFLLFFFNKLPSALTWYYTVSNTITLLLQIIIQKYIIDHDKILAKIEENRKKPKTKSKWQERMEQMQEQQRQMREQQQKNKRR